MEKTKINKSDWRVVEIDQTWGWADEIQENCGKIMTVFLYDNNVVTHCCEFTPSYYCIPIYYYIIYPDWVYDLPENKKNEHFDKWDSEVMGEIGNDSPSYYHVPYIDSIAAEHKQKLDKTCNRKHKGYESEDYRQLEHDAEEYVYENRPFQ